MRDSGRLWLGSVVMLFGVLAGSASAATIIGNLPGNDGTSTFINAPSGGSDGGGVLDSKAAGFTMPLGLDYALDSVLLRLNLFNLSSVPEVVLYDTDGGGNPGSPLVAFVNPAFALGPGTYSFSPSQPFVLDAGTTYWVVVSNATLVANSFQWLANNPSITPTGIATSAGYRFDNGAPPPVGVSTVFNSYEVQGTAVAVPAPPICVFLGVGVAAVLRRTMRR